MKLLKPLIIFSCQLAFCCSCLAELKRPPLESISYQAVISNIKGESKLFLLTKEETWVRERPDVIIILKVKRFAFINGKPKSEAEETVWQDCFDRDSQFVPQTYLFPSLLSDGDRIYLIIARSYQNYVPIRIYEIDGSKPSAVVLPNLADYSGKSERPDTALATPISKFNKEFSIDECGGSAVRGLLERDSIFVFINRFQTTCAPAELKFDLKKKQWFEIPPPQPLPPPIK